MGRPSTREKKMKDGYYIAVRNNGTDRPIKIRRSSKAQIDEAIEQYNKVKEVEYLGRVVDGKFVTDDGKKKKKKSKKKK